jgi:hypothetical protein
MVWTVDQDVLIDQFLRDQRIDVLVTNRPDHAARRRAELGLNVSRGSDTPAGLRS